MANAAYAGMLGAYLGASYAVGALGKRVLSSS
jgi:hypothetical protein